MLLLVVTITAVAVAIGAAAYAWRVRRADRLRSEARVATLAAAIDGVPEDESSSMFERAPRSGLQGRPLLKLGVGFAMAVLIIVLIAMSGDRPRASADSARVIPQQQVHQELELLSMRHSRSGTALKVTGLVRNSGDAVKGSIMAVVFVFDRQGGFVSSGRAPIEFATIASGDESPFQVTIPDVSEVGRYKVSFRTEAGVVPHVDRRTVLQASK